MELSGGQTKTSQVSLINRLKDVADKISSLKDKVEEMDSTVKEKSKS